MNSPTLKKGDQVVMHTCMEHDHPDNFGKVWTCRSDEFQHKGHDYGSVFLEGFSGSFSTEYLQIVDLPSVIKRLKEENDRLRQWKETKERIDDVTRDWWHEHTEKVKYLFPLENSPGIGQIVDRLLLKESQLQDALNTLKWYADGDNWIGQCTDVEIDKGWNAQQAIDRIQEGNKDEHMPELL